MTTHTVRIYTAEYDGKHYVEYLETRENTHLVTSEPTGVIYRTFRDMEDGTLAKNRGLGDKSPSTRSVMSRFGWLAPACDCTGHTHAQCCYGTHEQGIMHLRCCGRGPLPE